MESIVLMDRAHIFALGILPSFEEWNGKVYWDSEECAYKFLVINDQLVIGPIGDHSNLYAAHKTWALPTEEAKIKAGAIATEQWERPNYSISGAGKISADGRITGWKSDCYKIETPTAMRNKIESEVARLFQNGDLTPRPD